MDSDPHERAALARPAGQGVRLVYPRAGPARLDALDALGRQAALLYDDALAAGEHQFRLPQPLSAGVYTVRLRHSRGTESARVTIAR